MKILCDICKREYETDIEDVTKIPKDEAVCKNCKFDRDMEY